MTYPHSRTDVGTSLLFPLALVVASLVVPSGVTAQTGGPDAFGYTYAPATYDFVVLDGLGTSATSILLPFPFPYYGNTYTSVLPHEDGMLRF